MNEKNLSENEKKRIEYIYNMMDKFKKNYINIDDFEKCIISLGGEFTVKELSEYKSKKDKYTLDDLYKAYIDKNLNEEILTKKLNKAFSLFEVKEEGFIDNNSLNSILKIDNIPESDIKLIIKEFYNKSDIDKIEYSNLTDFIINYKNDN